jgi:DNA-binding HxlR family transcriptional regulator
MNDKAPEYCPVNAAMSVIEGRWKPTILCMLSRNGAMRFSELQRMIGGITSRMLSKQLKELESDGMIERSVSSSGKLKVTYAITEKGKSIEPILIELSKWGVEHQMAKVIVPDSSENPQDSGQTI